MLKIRLITRYGASRNPPDAVVYLAPLGRWREVTRHRPASPARASPPTCGPKRGRSTIGGCAGRKLFNGDLCSETGAAARKHLLRPFPGAAGARIFRKNSLAISQKLGTRTLRKRRIGRSPALGPGDLRLFRKTFGFSSKNHLRFFFRPVRLPPGTETPQRPRPAVHDRLHRSRSDRNDFSSSALAAIAVDVRPRAVRWPIGRKMQMLESYSRMIFSDLYCVRAFLVSTINLARSTNFS